jgi:hypothetical protein
MERTVEAWTRTRASGDRARKVLRDEALTVLGGTQVMLVAAVGPAPPIRHDVELELGEPEELDRAVVIPVRWHALGRERLFPRFAGELVVEHDVDAGARLRLSGRYAVPFGVVGRFGDGLAGRRVARRCMEDLLTRIASNLDAASGVDPDPEGHPYVVTVTEGHATDRAT